MEKYKWSSLTPLQIGKYAEFLVKMKFTLHAFDVYSAEIDDKGIDLDQCDHLSKACDLLIPRLMKGEVVV